MAFSWSDWGRREGSTSTTTSGSTSHSLLPTTSNSLPTTTSRSTSHHFQGHFSTEEVGSEVHPVYAQTTEGIRQHVLHFPPGSDGFREALKDGKGLLDHVATVYQPTLLPTTSTPEVPGGWQTVTTTHGEFDDHRSATALPPATQQTINAQLKTSVPAEDLQPISSTEDDWTASIRQKRFCWVLAVYSALIDVPQLIRIRSLLHCQSLKCLWDNQ